MSSTFAGSVCSSTAATLMRRSFSDVGGAEHRAGDRDAEAAAARPEVRRRRQRVLGHDADVVDLDAEVVGEHLRR